MKKTLSILFICFLLVSVIYNYCPDNELDISKTIDYIIIKKRDRELTVYADSQALKTYKISLGRETIGKKEFEGDQKTPEGIYSINDKNLNSSYHLNLGVSYPNDGDIEYAQLHGKPPGGLIKIHGMRNGFGFIGKFHRLFDWTLGCIAVTNAEIEELYHHVPIGTPIEIRP